MKSIFNLCILVQDNHLESRSDDILLRFYCNYFECIRGVYSMEILQMSKYSLDAAYMMPYVGTLYFNPNYTTATTLKEYIRNQM